MQATVLYIQDALCGWCYGFSPVMQRLHGAYEGKLPFDVLSGGMVPPEAAQPVRTKAAFIAGDYKTVEACTGVRFGEAYLQHIFHPEESPWVEESLTPATALCLLKAAAISSSFGGRDNAVALAGAIQRLHLHDGKDLTDGNSYRPLAESLNLDADDFIRRLGEEEWQEEARYEFALARQLGITGYPAVLLQTNDTKFYLIARGYTPYEDLKARLDNVLTELNR